MRTWLRLVLVAAVYLTAAAHGGGCGSSTEAGPAKTTTFTKKRGANTARDEGTHTTGTCSPEEVAGDTAACSGKFLIMCDVDGEPHVVDCTKKLGTDSCQETDTEADCVCSQEKC